MLPDCGADALPDCGASASGASDPAQKHDLVSAVAEALVPVAHLETPERTPKLEKLIRDYFLKAAKGVDFQTNFKKAVSDYADLALGSLWQGLGERPWLSQLDTLLVMDAAIKNDVPSAVLDGCSDGRVRGHGACCARPGL